MYVGTRVLRQPTLPARAISAAAPERDRRIRRKGTTVALGPRIGGGSASTRRIDASARGIHGPAASACDHGVLAVAPPTPVHAMRACRDQGKHRGGVFGYAHRPCHKCSGTGRKHPSGAAGLGLGEPRKGTTGGTDPLGRICVGHEPSALPVRARPRGQSSTLRACFAAATDSSCVSGRRSPIPVWTAESSSRVRPRRSRASGSAPRHCAARRPAAAVARPSAGRPDRTGH
jgi:hypothetical protein